MYKIPLYQKIKQNVLKLVEEKIKTNVLFPSVYDFEQKILINCVHFYKF